MNEFWLRVLGVPPGRIPEGAAVEFAWAHAPQSWGVFALIGGVIAGFAGIAWLYRREMVSCPPLVRTILAVLRGAVLILLVVVALGPVLAYTTRHQVDPFVVLAIDTSKSMAYKDKYLDDEAVRPLATARGQSPEAIRQQQPTRTEVIQELLARGDHEVIRKLAQKGKLRVVHFGEQAEVIETKPRLTLAAAKTVATTKGADEIVWPHLKLVFWVCLALVIGLAIVAYVQSLASLALVGAIPLTVGFFAVTLLVENNPNERPLALLGLEAVDQWMGYDAEAEAKKKEEESPLPTEKPFDPALPTLNPVGRTTDLARAIRKSLESTTSGPVSAIVLISDGRHTAAEEDVRKAASEAADRNVPVLTVGVGDISTERNLKIASVTAKERTKVDDKFPITVNVESKGYRGTVQVSLKVVDAAVEDATPLPVDTKPVTITGDGTTPLVFEHMQPRVGKFRYIAQIENIPAGQMDGPFNGLATVDAIDKKTRVLLVAGSPTWEYRGVQIMLTREKLIDVSCWLQSIKDMPQEGTTKIDKLPLTRQELDEYHVILLFDPDPADFIPSGSQSWETVMKDFLADGGGVLYMAGPKYTGQFLNSQQTQGISNIMPVAFGDPSKYLTLSLTEQYNRPFRIEPVPSTIDHAMTRFDSDPKNTLDRWQRMPPMYWSFPAEKVKPGFEPLLVQPNPQSTSATSGRPLLVPGTYLGGRVAYMGFNGTWRWRRLGKDGEYFTKFWLQTVNYLADARLSGSRKRGSITLSNNRFSVGQKMVITAQLKNGAGEPLADPQVTATVRNPAERGAGRSITLKPTPNKPGEYKAETDVLKEGSGFTVDIELPGAKANETIVVTSADFSVVLNDVEAEQRQLNKALLENVATLSSNQFKGQYFDVDGIDKLAEAVPERTEVKTIPGRPIELWDTNRLWFALLLLLTIEWGARKRFKLM